jgi:nucleoside-diphosphate-sugar epimerase
VVDAAVDRGWRVRGLARRRPVDWSSTADFVTADVLDVERIMELASGCNAIVHLAGSAHQYTASRSVLMRSFVEGARVVASSARTAGAQLVLVSSVAVYGTAAALVDERTTTRPDTPYGEAKFESEQTAISTHDATLVLRPAVVYGRYDRGNVARLIRAVSRFGPIVVGAGANRKSLLYAPHFAERIMRLLESGVRAGVWCAADSDAPTQAQLVATLAAILGRRNRAIHVPIAVAKQTAWAADLLTRSKRWSSTVNRLTSSTVVQGQKLDELLGYRESVQLELALAQAAAWALRGEAKGNA